MNENYFLLFNLYTHDLFGFYYFDDLVFFLYFFNVSLNLSMKISISSFFIPIAAATVK